jgi:quercetin dioxygenase-like cupin family protein
VFASLKQNDSTRRNRSIVLLVLFALAALVIGRIPLANAQETQPITVETLGSGMPSEAPGKALLQLRVTIQPGAAFPLHMHPGAVLITVQSGEFAFTVMEGQAEAVRGIASGTPEPAETLSAGQEAVFQPGDQIFEDGGVVHTARNPGDAPTVVLVAALVDPTEPFTQPIEMEGTATPTS